MRQNRSPAMLSTPLSSGMLAFLVLGSGFFAGFLTGCRGVEPQSELGAGPWAARDSMPREVYRRIATLEDARSDGGGQLQQLLAEGAPAVRLRAAEALGRLPYPDSGGAVTQALVKALERDAVPEVRAAAAFGLGLRADPDSAPALLARMIEPEPLVRARIVEAASRLDNARLREEVLYAMADEDVGVRMEAVTAPQRWPSDALDAEVVDEALVNVTRRIAIGKPGSTDAGRSEHPVVVWRALFSLQRRASERGRVAFCRWAHAADNDDARIFSIMGLGDLSATGSDEYSMRILRAALDDPNWLVAHAATQALGKHPRSDSILALDKVGSHPSPNVRRGAQECLGNFGEYRRQVREIVERGLVDESSNVRAAALSSWAQLFGDSVAADLELKLLERDTLVHAGIAQSCEYLSGSIAIPLLKRLAQSKDKRTAYLAVEGMGHHIDQDVRELLHSMLKEGDNGLRLAAVLALREEPELVDLLPLRRAWQRTRGDIGPEVRFNVLENVAAIGGEAAWALLVEALDDPHPFVARSAQRLLTEHEPARIPARVSLAQREPAELPEPESGYLNWLSSPLVELSTNRGVMVFELFPEQAPLHVFNFYELALKDHYDGLRFHRVVPNFVIQGGDYRGDGNGSLTWNGVPLRAEFNSKKYLRGALGMPRNEDPDSGGSQIFVTHRPTPHLDGRYTLFGQLREGFEVLDAIEVDDLILDVRPYSKL